MAERNNTCKNTLNKVKCKKVFTVNVFSKSEDLVFLKRLVEGKKYNDQTLFSKLFFSYESDENTYYLKNKYLYLTTKGIINYLGISSESEVSAGEIGKKITQKLEKDERHVVSLGAADSQKEKGIFDDLKANNKLQNVLSYVPIDVSPMLIQLGINRFSSDEGYKEFQVNSIVADFWHLAEYIKNKGEEEKKKIRKELFGDTRGNKKRLFLILGETFGNYAGSDLLEQVSEFMDEEDELIIDIQESHKFDDQAFLLAPLSYLPYFYGYTRYGTNFLKTRGKQRIIEDSNKTYILSQFDVNWADDLKKEAENLIVCGKKQLSNLESKNKYKKNRYTLNQVVFNKAFNVMFFSDSEELSFLGELRKERDYYDERIVTKLFNDYTIDNRGSDKYLKNKYLYITTMGIMNYLQLYDAQKKTLADFFSFEKSELKTIILDILNNESSATLNVVSLGAAISDKEAEVFRDIFEDGEDYHKKIRYVPVDISPMLIQLGINNFSTDKIFEGFEVSSLVADFWSIARLIKKWETEEQKKLVRDSFWNTNIANITSQKRLFIILGGTFGNYTEKEFLDQVLEFMNEGDELMISVKLQQNNKEYSPDKDYANLPGNEGFLLEPLTYIPLYYGYARYYRNYLVTNDNANISGCDEEIKFISDVPKSECTAPYVEVEEGEEKTRKKIRLCWSTRYDSEELKKWMVETYTMGSQDKKIYKLEYCTDRKGHVWYHKEQRDNCYAIMRLKKIKKSYKEELENLLYTFDLHDNDEVKEKIKELNDNGVIDYFFYTSCATKKTQNLLKKFLLKYDKKNKRNTKHNS